MARRGLVATAGRRRALAAPAAFLLAVTIAVVVVDASRHRGAASVSSTHHAVVAKRAAAAPRFYRVAAGDTLAAIAVKSGVSLARLRSLNPSLQPTALFIGENIRLR